MKQIMKAKILRKALVLAFLVVGLVTVLLDPGNSVRADPPTCGQAYADYETADYAYYDARLLYINNNPTSCGQVCGNHTPGTQPYIDCVNTCQTTRATAYYSTQGALFDKAAQTCAPDGLSYTCQDASQAASLCGYLYDTSMLTDQDEIDAVYAQYSACQIASKISTCQ